jgi:hypothetical protein
MRARAGFYGRLTGDRHPTALLLGDRPEHGTGRREAYVNLINVSPISKTAILRRVGGLDDDEMRPVTDRLLAALHVPPARRPELAPAAGPRQRGAALNAQIREGEAEVTGSRTSGPMRRRAPSHGYATPGRRQTRDSECTPRCDEGGRAAPSSPPTGDAFRVRESLGVARGGTDRA